MVGQIQPFDYSQTGIPAIQQALLGYQAGQGMQMARGQDARAAQDQTFQQSLQTEEMAMRQAAVAQAQADRQAADAERRAAIDQAKAGQAALTALAMDPAPSWEKVAAAMEANPAMSMELRKWYDGQAPDTRKVIMDDTAKLAYALGSGNLDLAKQMLAAEAAAAEAGGDKAGADQANAMAAMLDVDGGAEAVKSSLLGTIHTIATPEELAAIGGQLFPVADPLEWRAATPEEAAANGAIFGQVNIKTGKFDAQNPPSQTRIVSTPGGGVEIVQGPGAGMAQGEPPLAGLQPAQADAVLTMIDEIDKDPSLNGITGAWEGGGGNNVDEMNLAQRAYYGDKGLALIQKIDQLKNNTYMAARAMLKGGGAITEQEANKAENAIARLSRAQGTEDFRAALKDLRDAITDGQAKLAANGGGAPAAKDTAGLPRVTNGADYEALPVGTEYFAPDGTTRTKR